MKKTLCIFLTLMSSLLLAETQKTLSIIKPDAVQAQNIGKILTKFEENGLQIVAMRMIKLTPERSGEFYAEHKGRPFYPDLVEFMSSGPIVAIVLKGEDAIAKNRQLMGATDPAKATQGTLRALFALSTTKNAVHGSDSPQSAEREISFFFTPAEIY
ncbi:MAG: nucleoside-diphosphate kinase [Parachlamydia sp.]|nr:MAG: nucleoside-diphosphate kinase [Parachlamydia sp.]